MERLTARRPDNGLAYLKNVKADEQEVDSQFPNTLKCILESLKHLADYEDTGLTPEEIPHWIPCSERMPENESLVLTFGDRGIDIDYYDSGKYMPNWESIIYWMPLPQPPKEGK